VIFFKISSPRASRLALGEEFFFESIFFALSEEILRREYFFYSRQRGLRRELEIKLSPKNIALGEDSVSRSVWLLAQRELGRRGSPRAAVGAGEVEFRTALGVKGGGPRPGFSEDGLVGATGGHLAAADRLQPSWRRRRGRGTARGPLGMGMDGAPVRVALLVPRLTALAVRRPGRLAHGWTRIARLRCPP
jgi:hypothetical protein